MKNQQKNNTEDAIKAPIVTWHHLNDHKPYGEELELQNKLQDFLVSNESGSWQEIATYYPRSNSFQRNRDGSELDKNMVYWSPLPEGPSSSFSKKKGDFSTYTQDDFKNLLRSAEVPFFDDVVLEAAVESVSISDALALQLQEFFSKALVENKKITHLAIQEDITFKIFHIQHPDPFWAKIAAEFPDYEFAEMRLHFYEPHEQCTRHRDNIHDGYSSMSIRINDGDSRFIIGQNRIDEKFARGYILPEHTMHGVSIGGFERMSLVAWLKKK